MAKKRMFSSDVVDNDKYMDLPDSAHKLYFFLNLAADNEGFVNNKRAVMRKCNCTEDDLQELIKGDWVIQFETGVLVITHWRMHNTLKNDRCNSAYKAEKSCLKCIDNIYYLCEKGAPGNILETNWKRSGNILETNWKNCIIEEEERKRGKEVEEEKEEEEEHEQEGEKEGEVQEGEIKRIELPQTIYEDVMNGSANMEEANSCIDYYQLLVGGEVYPNYKRDILKIAEQYGAQAFIGAVIMLKEHNLDYSLRNIDAICWAAKNNRQYADIVCKTQK